MHFLAVLPLLAILQGARAHGDHGGNDEETNEQYAARHMASEHHIDSFDIKSFFHLHDLNRDGVWDRSEIEAIWGVHHVYSQKLSADDKAHQEKADTIVNTVLRNVDTNGDEKITPEELEKAGLNALPNFKELGAEGHHYDVESEFFLHHEEIYHNTPETQTDEAYNHPEDIEHFAQHASIEAVEEARERVFQGIPDDEPLNPGHDHGSETAAASEPSESGEAAPEHPAVDHPHDDQKAFEAPEVKVKLPQRETSPENLPPEIKFGKAAQEGKHKEEWGQGTDGYKRPRTPADKMRKNLPYKSRSRTRSQRSNRDL
ncbi:hypothetical protein M422DRAFT_25420 [Sphaerobolus stellatus SS14]|nr:hypothetical protein M422DRAFT_25420 [Sphaerobolus stellatus SS14]